MITVLIGWYARKLYDRWKRSKEPKPHAVYTGEVTLNQPSAGPLSSEMVLGEYDPKTGTREILKDAEKVPQSSRLTTWLTDDDGLDKISIRWEKRSGRFKLAKALKGETWRIEFYKVKDREPVQVDEHRGQTSGGFNPFGGGGVFS